jgi:TonB family protein
VSRRAATILLALFPATAIVKPIQAAGQEAQTEAQNEALMHRAKVRVEPIFPELARKMNISGTVRIAVVVLPSGVVKEAKIVGGHPVLAGAALDAARKWRFEPGTVESSGVIDFKFQQK